MLQRHYDPEIVMAEVLRKKQGESSPNEKIPLEPFHRIPYRIGDVHVTEKLEKFLEDVK